MELSAGGNFVLRRLAFLLAISSFFQDFEFLDSIFLVYKALTTFPGCYQMFCYEMFNFKITLVPPTGAQQSNATTLKTYAEGYCSMYGICGRRSDGKILNCPYNVPSVKPDELLSLKIQSLCPTITGNVCCTADQFDTLRGQVQQAIPFLVGCPACLRNFLNLFCELSCSPNQSLFINVTSVMKVNDSLTVDGIDFYVTSQYVEELFNSCKDVKFGTMNTRAMDFVGAGAQNYKEWLAFIGHQANPNEPGSPYAIAFQTNLNDLVRIKPMNVTVYSCGDSSLGCSCGDCPSSSVCFDSASPSPHEKQACATRIGHRDKVELSYCA
ncbi:putative NPC intracellular cholesterol transporter 1 [Cocos nucifera]|uniref:Putative NPC intracellular cholesterol transporter 1 n=1 Tax=Cocos nucifera TaxID=13894 RepID=A0A8K0N990_COCNU|nr:putative NPC intracellular cholesterol transporter 1 [Cocos nucifera]